MAEERLRGPEDGFQYGPYIFTRGRWWYRTSDRMKVAVETAPAQLLNELYRAVDVLYRLAEVDCVHCQAERDAGNRNPILGHHDEPYAVQLARGFLESRLTG